MRCTIFFLDNIPNSFGNGNFGIRVGVVFGATSKQFASVEDERCLQNVYKVGSSIFENGSYSVPDAPGLGLEIDADTYGRVYAGHEAVAGGRAQGAQ